ncbi:MAG: hypothetical protein ACRDGQ_06800 [Candidatus Limnocylindrales bacterium]
MAFPVRPRRLLAVLAIVVAGSMLAGCVSDPDAPASFDPGAPCNGADSQVMAGAYPELEALLPTSLVGVAPTSVESGRLCSAATLGTLYGHGIHETHFGSAVWDRGGGSGIQMTVMEATGLTVANAIESYNNGAANAPKVHLLTTTNVMVNGIAGMRLDIENDDFQQEVVIWPTGTPGRLRVLIASNTHAPDLEAALADFR